MREIKFRVWNYREKKYHKPFKGCSTVYNLSYYEDTKHVNYPEQFIGIQDKHGEDAYELDIVEYEYYVFTSVNPESSPLIFKGIGVIKFIEGAFMIVPHKENPIPLHYPDLSFKVIGNVLKSQDYWSIRNE